MPQDFIISDPIDLSNCEKEPIHIPNKIQPFGFLLAVDLSTFQIVQFSNNLNEHLGNADLLGRNLAELLPKEELEKIQAAISDKQLAYLNPMELHYEPDRKNFLAVLHISDGFLIVENEKVIDSFKFTDYYSAANRLMEDLKRCKSLDQLSNTIVKQVRQLTRYDRVMVYEFDSDWNGTVIAESRHLELYSFLGQHFPASDIPAQARTLYIKNPLRIIPDVDYKPIELLPVLNPKNNKFIDLSKSFLRSVSPIHIEYLQNMGVRATLVISIIIDDRLWGLIACHHYYPKFIDCRLRSMLEHFGNIFAYNIDLLDNIRLKEIDLHSQTIETEIIKKLNQENDFFYGLAKQLPLLLKLNSASGVVLYFGENSYKEGIAPGHKFLTVLVDWLFVSNAQTIFQTNCLSSSLPEAEEYVSIASGILAVRLTKYEKNYLIWFKPETLQSLVWGGNPKEKILAIPTDDGFRLSPRKSFEKWEEVVRRKAIRWEKSELKIAENLRNYFQEFIANQMSFLEAQNLELNIKIQEKVLETKRAYQQLQLINEQVSEQNEKLRLQNDSILNLFQELKNHKNQLKAIFDNTRHSIILLDVDGKLLFFNDIAKQNTQFFYKRELEYGEVFTTYARTKEEQVRLADRFERALLGESFVFDEDIFHEQFESSVWFRIEYDPVYEEQRLIGVAILMTDISAMKRATKRIENQNQTLREIAFLQSHRVRRPLANILGLISVFNRKNMTDPFNHLVLEKLLFSTQELDEIIRSIVDKTYGVD